MWVCGVPFGDIFSSRPHCSCCVSLHVSCSIAAVCVWWSWNWICRVYLCLWTLIVVFQFQKDTQRGARCCFQRSFHMFLRLCWYWLGPSFLTKTDPSHQSVDTGSLWVFLCRWILCAGTPWWSFLWSIYGIILMSKCHMTLWHSKNIIQANNFLSRTQLNSSQGRTQQPCQQRSHRTCESVCFAHAATVLRSCRYLCTWREILQSPK